MRRHASPPLPVVGFVGASGSGKTTLIAAVLPLLRAAGLRVAVLKHAHHGFQMDHPGKDSFRIREAGAFQVLIASRSRWALLSELDGDLVEPPFRELLGHFDGDRVDIVLAEGFAGESYPKIEVHRRALGKPPRCWPADPTVIAVATDAALEVAHPVERLDLNSPREVTVFLLAHLTSAGALPSINPRRLKPPGAESPAAGASRQPALPDSSGGRATRMSTFRRAVRSFCQLLAILLLASRAASAQSPAAPPSTIQSVLFARARMESWDWFDAGPAGQYEYVGVTVRAGLTRQSAHFAWRAEFALPMLIGLPHDAALPPPAGQLGGGATTFEASGQRRNLIHVLARQLWVRWGRPREGPALKAGRFDFHDGAERTPKHQALAALRSQRINQRLIGTFAFTHVQRSFDGGVASFDGAENNLTVAAMRPTAGVFAARPARSLDVNLLYGAWSRDIKVGSGAADLRLFGIFSDDRRGVVPADNRPLAARQADTRSLRVVTLGGHWLQAVPTGLGGVDLLAWGVLQRGNWGSLKQRSGAVALEMGFEPRKVLGHPWMRAGMVHSSGDDDPADDRHETFYQVLPTPRVYARHPFYNMMNSGELFASMQIRPHPKLTARVSAHRLRLTESTDLWYLGGGAFEPTTFGFAGRPANNARGLATVVEGTLEYRPDRHWAFEVFGNSARGGPVVKRIYGGSGTARLLYLESSFTW